MCLCHSSKNVKPRLLKLGRDNKGTLGLGLSELFCIQTFSLMLDN